MKKIALDIDDVLLDSVPLFLEYYNDKHGKNLTMKDLEGQDYFEFLGQNQKELEEIIYMFNNSDYFFRVEPIAGAKEAVAKLAEKAEIFALTSRPVYIKAKTEALIREYFPEITEVIFNNHNVEKSGIFDYSKPKPVICKNYGASVFVDDQIRFVEEACEGLDIYLFDKPWNHKATPPGVTRVYNWEELYNNIESTL